ncbi:MAG TPA: hypothetical protein VF792_08840 [Ktedonobacterales bacterium]
MKLSEDAKRVDITYNTVYQCWKAGQLEYVSRDVWALVMPIAVIGG